MYWTAFYTVVIIWCSLVQCIEVDKHQILKEFNEKIQSMSYNQQHAMDSILSRYFPKQKKSSIQNEVEDALKYIEQSKEQKDPIPNGQILDKLSALFEDVEQQTIALHNQRQNLTMRPTPNPTADSSHSTVNKSFIENVTMHRLYTVKPYTERKALQSNGANDKNSHVQASGRSMCCWMFAWLFTSSMIVICIWKCIDALNARIRMPTVGNPYEFAPILEDVKQSMSPVEPVKKIWRRISLSYESMMHSNILLNASGERAQDISVQELDESTEEESFDSDKKESSESVDEWFDDL